MVSEEYIMNNNSNNNLAETNESIINDICTTLTFSEEPAINYDFNYDFSRCDIDTAVIGDEERMLCY